MLGSPFRRVQEYYIIDEEEEGQPQLYSFELEHQ
jgi:hypothetical protein